MSEESQMMPPDNEQETFEHSSLEEPIEPETIVHSDSFPEEDQPAPMNINPRLVIFGIAGLALLVVIVALVALFLPPFNLAGQLQGCKPLDANNPSLLGEDGIGATWIGPDSLRLCTSSIALQDFLAGQGAGDFKDAAASIPSYLQLKSPVYKVTKQGDGQATLDITLPSDVQAAGTVDLYSWDSKAHQWVFVPGQVDAGAGIIRTDQFPSNVAAFQSMPITPLISTTLESGNTFDPNVGSALNMVFPAGIVLQSDQTLAGSLVGGWQLGAGYAVIPVVRAQDPASLSALLNNPTAAAQHVSDLRSFVVSDGYSGIAIDYQGVSPTDQLAFSQFIASLSQAMRDYNKLTVVILPAPTNVSGTWNTGGYDWRAIGGTADAVVIKPGDNPADYALNGPMQSMLTWAVGEISRVKIHLAMSARSAQDVNGAITLMSYDEALAPLGKVKLNSAPATGDRFDIGSDIGFALDGDVTNLNADQNTGAYNYQFTDGSGQKRIWIVTAATVRARLDIANTYHIGGMVINDLLADGADPAMMTAVNEFKAASVSTVPSQLTMNWTVNGASGAVLTQSTGLGTPLVWKADNPGDFTVQGAIVGSHVSDRGSVALKVGAPATPTPTAAPVIRSGGGNTAVPAAPTTPPPPPPPPVASGGGGGTIELGGQVPGGIGHAAYMHQANMSWVKYQMKFGSVGADAAGGYVAEGHANGFKVLISTPGPHYPTSIDYAGYVNYIGQVAAAQPDAIEVWNEMNINNEWPVGQIDPNAYVNQMLAPAFNKIKAVSPNTMVIIGALAPTGCDDGTNCWSDVRYLQGMAAAGAANYANCLGIHHNAGATAPDASTGHPAGADSGDHYSWYFMPTISAYRGSFGTSLPLCFTEFGYVSPEGFPGISQTFWWGAGNTVAEQAAWLAQGYQLAKGLGYVRLVIVWNVDFTYYDPNGDPQAGYAIVRPDGSCPACASLGAVAP